MNLNPLSSNYLNNLAFERNRSRKLASSPTKLHIQPNFSKKEKSQKPQKNEPLLQKQEKFYWKSAEFQLKQKLNTSHLFYTKQGYIFGLKKRDGCIEKKAVMVFPDGTIGSCYVQRGKLNGWAVLCKRNSFYNIFQYKNSRLEGQQFIYDIKCGLMLRSNYQNGRLKSILKCCAQNQTNFHKFVNNKAIYNILKETLNSQFFKGNFPCVQCSIGNFYGKKIGEIPDGLGILITRQQLFYGQFERGLLNGIGTISFQGGNYYIGQLQNGITRGIGQFSTNGKTFYKYNDSATDENVFDEYFKIAGWEQDEQIRSIFQPIINFYHKIRKIQIQRMSQADVKDISVVGVDIAPEEQQQGSGTDKKDSSSPSQTDRVQIITTSPPSKNYSSQERIDKQEIKKEINQQFIQQGKPDQQQQHTLNNNEKKNNGRLVRNDKKKAKNKQKANENKLILNEKEWQEIIQQLQGQQSLGREDGFLQPSKQNLKEGGNEEILNKPNPKNSNQKRMDLVKINEPDKIQITEKQEHNLKKIMRKPAKKS